MNFIAVILAGGQSSRMGRDKAWLEINGQTLLARQIALAREIGAHEVFISGRLDVDYAEFGCRVLKDRLQNAGPLAGIEAALGATAVPLLLVLAVDMPHMNAELLRQLATRCTGAIGAIPLVNGNIEPLAAFYPTSSLNLVTELVGERPSLTPALSRWERESQSCAPANLDERPANSVASFRERRRTILPLPAGEGRGEGERGIKSRSAKNFAERCVASGLATFVDLPAQNAKFFANWNSPADVVNLSAAT